MSKLLEQAIVDAEALKEAALKSAETAILEKYSAEVKDAIETILEQEEGGMPGPAMGAPPPLDVAPVAMAPEMAAEEGDDFPDMPRADMDDLTGLDKDEEIEIDFNELAAELEGEMTDRDEIVQDQMMAQEEPAAVEPPVPMGLAEGLSEEFEISDDIIDSIIEKLEFDVRTVPTGQVGGATNPVIQQEVEDIELARLALEGDDDDVSEKKELQEKINALTHYGEKLLEENNKYKTVMYKLKEKLEEINLSNARLFYTNKVLGSTSLNERQKINIVESLSNTSTVEETKVIYDTLQGAVGSESKLKPQSLSEAIGRPSAVIPRKEEKSVKEPVSNRWKTLAGINKS